MQNEMKMIALNGVYYAMVKNQSEYWRIGSIVADWQARLALFPSKPDSEELEHLENMGIFPGPDTKPKALAVMCAGLGAAWPGMGRELYDNFPAARAAMDEIASLADWDVLSLMDEKDSEIINSSRYQIPYLFLLEYAQWQEFRWLGLQPALICGHSLGELVALCLAGVYPVEGAWLLLDTRARHMAHLEKMGNGKTGMLAVSAERTKIDEVLKKWPSLAISNANTPKQFVLGGPRSDLLEARRELRRHRIPAFMLPINLAFHNPEMRILRDLSTRRLNALEMHQPHTPFLSCVTADLYPDKQEQISRAIADLDENTVDWISSVTVMRNKYKIRTFLELGPQDILCGLTKENDSEALCIPADLKYKETFAMRRACARLFAEGNLPYQRLAKLKIPVSEKREQDVLPDDKKRKTDWTAFGYIPEKELDAILSLLAKIGNYEKEKLCPDMDLKYDLGLRSSNFPLLIQEAEKSLNKSYEIENIFNLSTVGDLVVFLAGKSQRIKDSKTPDHEQLQNSVFGPPLSIWCWQGQENFIKHKIDIEKIGPLRKKTGPILLLCPDSTLLDSLWEGLVIPGQILCLPFKDMEACNRLKKAGAILVPLSVNMTYPGLLAHDEIIKFKQEYGSFAGIFFTLPIAVSSSFIPEQNISILKNMAALIDILEDKPWICLLQILKIPDQTRQITYQNKKISEFFQSVQNILKCKTETHCICWQDARNGSSFQNRNEGGDLLSLNLLYGNCGFEIWSSEKNDDVSNSLFCLDPDGSFYEQESQSLLPRASSWRANLQYSLFASPEYASHGPGGKAWSPTLESPINNEISPWLPTGEIASRMLEAGNYPLPWLIPATLQDFNLFMLPFLPQGITRECRATVLERPWLIQNGSYVRLAKIEMASKELLQNGRSSENWKNMADCIAAYGHMAVPPKGLWPKDNLNNPIATDRLDKFYGKINFGQCWRHLVRVFRHSGDENILCFTLNLSESRTSIAPKKDWGYIVFSQLVESLAQAAFFSAMQSRTDNSSNAEEFLNEWSIGSIGFLQFDWKTLSAANKFILEIRQAWQTASMLRYDAQILLEKDKIALTMTHLELVKRESEQSD